MTNTKVRKIDMNVYFAHYIHINRIQSTQTYVFAEYIISIHDRNLYEASDSV